MFFGREIPEKLYSVNYNGSYIFAILGFIFAGSAVYSLNLCKKEFISVCCLLLSFFYSSIFLRLNPYIEEKFWEGFAGFCSPHTFCNAILLFLYVLSFLWIYLKYYSRQYFILISFLIPGIAYLIDNLFCIIFFNLCALIILSIKSIATNSKLIKCVIVFGIASFFIITTWIYLPMNPLLGIKNIKHIYVSSLPRQVSLIVKENDKYALLDGLSLRGEKLVDEYFDFYSVLPYVGFESNKQDNENTVLYELNGGCNVFENNEQGEILGTNFPIVITNKHVWFSTKRVVFNELKKNLSSSNDVYRLTSQIYFDYISLFAQKDSSSFEQVKTQIKKDYHELQSKLDEFIGHKESMKTKKDPVPISNVRNLLQNMSLGMLNTLSLDLINDDKYTPALSIFYWQFVFTFCNNKIFNGFEHLHLTHSFMIYKAIDGEFHNTTAFLTETPYRERPCLTVAISDLTDENAIEPWISATKLSMAICSLYIDLYLDNSTDEYRQNLMDFMFKIRNNKIKFFEVDHYIKSIPVREKYFYNMDNYISDLYRFIDRDPYEFTEYKQLFEEDLCKSFYLNFKEYSDKYVFKYMNSMCRKRDNIQEDIDSCENIITKHNNIEKDLKLIVDSIEQEFVRIKQEKEKATQ